MKTPTRFFAFVLTCGMLFACISGFVYAKDSDIRISSPGNVSIHTSVQLAYLNDDYNNVSDYADGTSEISRTEPILLSYSASDKLDVDYYRVIISAYPDFRRKICYKTEDEELELFNVMIGRTYFFKVVAFCGDEEYESGVSSFYVADECPRNLYIDGITNARDLGGWKTADGCRVRQGLIYRTGRLNETNSTANLIKEDGIEQMRDVLKIKSEIDLRLCGPLGFEAPGEIAFDEGELYYFEKTDKVFAGVIMVDGKIYYAGAGGKIFGDGRLNVTSEKANGIVEPGEYSFDENGVMKNPKMVYYENGAISRSPLARSDQNGLIREKDRLIYYTNGKAEELGVIMLGGNLHYVSSGGLLDVSCSRYISKTNGMIPPGVYSIDMQGRIVSDNRGISYEVYPLKYGYKGSGVYDVNYFPCSMQYTGDILYDNSAAIRQVFEILSDRNNYPLIMHCTIGTDRTGMMSYLINGLVGVEKEELLRDYLFSNFGMIGSSRNVEGIKKKYIDKIDAFSGKTLSEKIYNCLNTEIGVPKEQLDAVISIMKEYPEQTGNVNRDEAIDERDAVILSRYLAGYDIDIDLSCADINHDGSVTDWDYVLLSRYLAGWFSEIG